MSLVLSSILFLQQSFASYEVNSCKNEIISRTYDVWTENTNHIIKERLVDVWVNFSQRGNDSAIWEYRTFLTRWINALSDLQREVNFNQTQNNMIEVVKDFLTCQKEWATTDAGILIGTTLWSINPDGSTNTPQSNNNDDGTPSAEPETTGTTTSSQPSSSDGDNNDETSHRYYQYLSLHSRAIDNNGSDGDQNCVILHGSGSRSTNGWYSSSNSCEQLCDGFDGDTKMCFHEGELLKTYWSIEEEEVDPDQDLVSCSYNDTQWSRNLWNQTPSNCISLCDYHSGQWQAVISCAMNQDIVKYYEIEEEEWSSELCYTS